MPFSFSSIAMNLDPCLKVLINPCLTKVGARKMSGALLKFGSFKSKRSFLVLFFYIYIHTDDVLLLTFNYILKNICQTKFQ